jgi:PEGA domain-containing protein
MLVIGLLAGFVGGFLTGQRMMPSMPTQVGDLPRSAPSVEAQPPAASPAVAVTEPAVVAPPAAAERPAVVEPPAAAERPAVVKPPAAPERAAAVEPPAAVERRPVTTPSRPRTEPAPARPTVESKPAMLELASRPLGATVYVDDVRVGVTPVTLNDVMPGMHRIRMEMFGHQTWTTTVNVETGAHVRIGASLE